MRQADAGGKRAKEADATGRAAPFDAMLSAMWSALGGPEGALDRVRVTGAAGDLPSAFAVSDLAAASVAAAGLALSEEIATGGGAAPAVSVDRRLAGFWFSMSLRPQGWSLPPLWDAIAGDYRAADGWIRLHTNAPAHRRAALSVLGVPAEREAVEGAVAAWPADRLETAVVEAGGCAAAMRSAGEWAAHPQGRAVAGEPLLALERTTDCASPRAAAFDPARPLAGVRVLDLTRVLAGPVATRFLAAYGADVLRIDPPGWDEPGVIPEVMAGKRSVRLDLRTGEGRDRLLGLIRGADVLVHGYRPGALEGLGLDMQTLRAHRPGLVAVSLDAYGFSGPWAGRRGFDSLVQMSSGIAEAGMRSFGKERPTPLPVQALDHATGYLIAAAAIRGLSLRRESGAGVSARASLARTAALLIGTPAAGHARTPAAETPSDLAPDLEATGWGPARRLVFPLTVVGCAARFDRPARPLGGDAPAWLAGA